MGERGQDASFFVYFEGFSPTILGLRWAKKGQFTDKFIYVV